jgi:hypothetical protein
MIIYFDSQTLARSGPRAGSGEEKTGKSSLGDGDMVSLDLVISVAVRVCLRVLKFYMSVA